MTLLNRFISFLAILLTLVVIAVSADLFRRIGLSLYTEQYLAGLLAVAMPLLYLSVPIRGPRKREVLPPWYDVTAAITSFICCAYIVARFSALSELVSARPWDGLIVASLTVLLVLEGLRRTVGSALLYTTVGFFLLAMFGSYLPGELAAKSIPADRLTYFVVWDSSAMLGITLKIVATVVVIFVLFGQVLFRTGGAVFFTDLAMALMGRYRGGPAKIAIVGSSIFGSVSGNVVSNVLTVGVVTIPLMIRVGFRRHLAAAIEATASTGGQMMPPVMGVAAFVMAEFLQVPFYEVALAALIPALLFYFALFVQVDLEAARSKIRAMDGSTLPKVRDVLRHGWYFPLPFIVLVIALFGFAYEPEMAGLAAIAVTFALALIWPFEGKRLTFADLLSMLRDTGLSVLDLFMLGAASGIMIGALNYSGAGFTLSIVLLHLASGSLIALLILAAIANIVLGLGLPTIACYIVLATLVAPTLVQMGIDPMAAHMFILYYGCLSMISPPVAIAAFVAANLANADHNKTGWTAMAFGWTLFVVPFLFVYSTSLLMKGSPLLIMVDILAAALGIWLVAAAVMGYSTRRLHILERCAYVLAGVCVFLPAAVQPSARWINLAGLIFVGSIAAWHRWGPSAPEASVPAADQNESLPRDVAALPKNEREALEKMGVMGTIEGA